MKKLLEKDKKLRKILRKEEKKHFILKSIYQNTNMLDTIRWNALVKLQVFTNNIAKTSLTTRCILTKNKKRFNKLAPFSRQILLRSIRKGLVNGMTKATW